MRVSQQKKMLFLLPLQCMSNTWTQNAAHAELMLMHRMNSICCQTICAETDDDDDGNALERGEERNKINAHTLSCQWMDHITPVSHVRSEK